MSPPTRCPICDRRGLGIDWQLFGEQRQAVLERAAAEPTDVWDGLLELLDAIGDFAVDELGIPERAVFPGIAAP